MRKRIFITIGAVMGAVLAFVGAVLGVLAIMGKFKTPVVRPEDLFFDIQERTIVAQYHDKDGKEFLYSFELKATNNTYKEFAVNHKTCYLRFYNNIGDDLITLCDAEGTPLKEIEGVYENGKYKINCNEKIYYKLKSDEGLTVDPESDINGKVVLTATTEDNMHNTKNEELVIWIDRSVSSVFLNYGQIPVAKEGVEYQEQQVDVGINIPLDISYVINPEISLNPISKESEKIVELYYDPGDDYILVNETNLQLDALKDIFTYNSETQTYSFEATGISTHKFKIAIFPTYQAKIDFEASEYAQLNSNFVRLDRGVKEFGLVVTDLRINVVNTNIDMVSIGEDDVILNLFAENDYISVRGNSGVDKANDNNLQVTMLRDGKDFDLRLDEIAFNATSSRYFGLPVFKMRNAETGVLDTIDLSATKPEDVAYNSSSQTLTIDGCAYNVNSKIEIDGYKVISKLVNDKNHEFHCNNGVALINNEGKFRVLKNGSYLDFYVRDEFGNLTMTTNSTFDYEVVKVQADYNTWQIKTKSEPKLDPSNESLMLGLLVVNNDGLFIVDNFFKTKEVTTNVVDLSYETHLIEDTLDVVLKGYEFTYEEKDFENFVSVYGGSYTANIFVIEEDELDKSLVKTLDAYFELGGKKYYIVGEMDVVNNVFINKVIAKEYADANTESTTTLKLLQLKNGYNEEEQRQQTAEEFITELMLALPADKKIDENNVYKLFNAEKVTIKQKLAIDIDAMIKDSTIKVETVLNGVDSYYEGTSGHILYIMSDVEGLIARLDKFYDITNAANISTYFETNYPNVQITSITKKESGGKINAVELGFKLDSKIYGNPDVTIGLKGLFVSGEIYDSYILTTFKIASSAPENIIFSPVAGINATLTKETTDASIPEVVAKISWDEVNGYKTTWSYGGWSSETFNLNTEDTGTKNGFYDETYKIDHSISYDLTDNCVVENGNSLEAVSAGESYLAVTMGGETRYLKITVEVNGFGLTKIKDSITGTTGKLSELISYYYDDDLSVDTNEVTEIINLATYAKLDNFTFQHADKLTAVTNTEDLTIDGKTYTYVFENTAKTPILGITKTDTDWEFTRIENVYSALTVRFKVKTRTNTLDMTLNFEQDVMHDLNVSAWGEKPKLYAGTTILLYEVKKSLGEFTNQPLLKIINKGSSNVSVTSNPGAISIGSNYGTITIPDDITEINVTISVDGVEFDPYTFNVVPNVVVKQSDSAILEIASGTTYNFDNKKIFNNDLIKLYNYNSLYSGNTLVFGQTQLTGGQIALYSNNSDSVLTDCTEANYQSLILSSTYVNKTSGSENIVAKLVKEIGFSEYIEIKVSFGTNEIGTISAKFVNNYNVACPTQTGDEINIKAMINIADLFKVGGGVNASSFYLTSIAWTSSDADNNYNEGPYTLVGENLIIPTLSKRYDNATLTLKFSDGTNELTYTGKTINSKVVTINVVPFELEPTNTDAYSEKTFNLLSDVYSKNDIDLYISKIEVLSVLDASGNSLTGSTFGIVYSKADSVTDRTIEFNAINVNKTKAYITYLITYIDNVTTYEYIKEITLLNRQEIEVKRSYGDGYKLSDNFKYDDNSAPVYLENVVYEPVVVNVSNETTIDLINYDKVLHISRLVAKDKATGDVEDLQVRELKLIAYQNSIGIKDYINKGITINNGKITLPKGENIDGVLIFKLTSTTGYSVEYAIRVYGARNSKVNVNNYTEVFEVDSSKSIKDAFDENIKANFNATYGVIYTESVVDMFVLDAVTLASDYKEFDGTIFTSVNRYSKITTETPVITNYTKITIGFVYRNGPDMYPLGTATLNYLSSSLPTLTNGTQVVEGTNSNLTFDKKVTGKETGEYTALLDPNATQVNNPLTGYSIDTSKSIYSSDYIGEIDADNNIKIKTRNTSNENYKFTIFYVKDDVYVKVKYTYPKLSIPEEKYVTVGTVKVDSDDENSYFDNFVEINGAYLGDYLGNITIEGNDFIVSSDYKFVNGDGDVLNVTETSLKENCNYSITDGVFKIIFTQGLMDAEREIEFNFTEAGIKRTHTFLVKAGVQVNTSSDSNNGVYEAQRKVTQTPDGGLKFDQLTGTVIPITKTSIKDDGVKYTIGGYSIYIKDAGKLKILFAEEYQKYVVEYANLGDTLADTEKYVELDSTNINFVHLAVPAGVNLTAQIYVLNSSGEYYKVDELTNLVNNFYINVAPTYSDIESVYVTNGAKAENVVKGDKTIIDLASHLLTDITAIDKVSTNGARLKLKMLDNSYLNSGFAGMGLKEYGNPNYLNFSVQSGATIKSNIVEEGEPLTKKYLQAIEFSDANISNNQMCNVSYGNNAGISDRLYKFQIMADDSKEGIELSTEAYSTSSYISFAVNKDDGKELNYTTGVLYIGKLKDDENVKTYLNELKFSVNGSVSSGNFITESSYNFGSKVVDIREKYVYTAGDYTIAIAVTNTLEIYLKLDRASGSEVTPFSQITISLKLHGSTDYIFNGFEIVLFNVEVGSKVDGIDTSIYGGETVTLTNKLTIPDGATLEFDWENSEYGIGNLSKFDKYFEDVLILYSNSTQIGYGKTDNATSIKFQPVGQNVTFNLVFKVKLNDKYVTTVKYQLLLYKNLQVSFNGDVWETKEELKDDSQLTYTTYFVLTNGEVENNFATPLTIQFTSNTIIEDADYRQGTKNVYYKILAFGVYDTTDQTLSWAATIRKNTNMPNPSDDICVVNNNGITFKQDYTGKLYLIVQVTLTNGFNYVVYWEIDVTGILQFNQTENAENGVISNNGIEFKSGSSVKVVNTAKSTDTGLVLTKDNLFGQSDIKHGEISLNGEYVVVKYNPNDGKTNEERFSTQTTKVPVSGSLSGDRFETKLPIVASDGQYLVIYKVNLTYLGYTTQNYYIAYLVKNDLNISVASVAGVSGSNVNVDTRLLKVDEKYYLDLFYFEEKITHEETTYTIIYNGTNKVLKISDDANEYVYNSINNRYEYNDGTLKWYIIYYDNGTGEYTISYGEGEGTATDIENIKTAECITKYSNQYEGSSTTETTDDKYYLSVFDIAFNNAEEFEQFVKSVYASDKYTIKIGDVYFKLEPIGDGRLGIDLTAGHTRTDNGDGTFTYKALKDDSNVLFNNDLVADLTLLSIAGDPIYTLNDFELTTNSTITAKDTIKLSTLFAPGNITEIVKNIGDCDIIGVYSDYPSNLWLNNGEFVDSYVGEAGIQPDVIDELEIKVQTGKEIYATYKLQKIKCSSDAGGGITGIYSLDAEFFVIKAPEYYGGKVYKANYNTVMVNPFDNGDTIVDISNTFKAYYFDVDTERFKEDSIEPTAINPIANTDLPLTILTGSYKLIASEATLADYKNSNPDSRNVKCYYSAVVTDTNTTPADITLYCGFTFALPSEFRVVKNFKEGSLFPQITIPSRIEDIVSIQEVGSIYADDAELENKVIDLDTSLLQEYFTTNERLEIEFLITTENGNETLIVVINKGDTKAETSSGESVEETPEEEAGGEEA